MSSIVSTFEKQLCGDIARDGYVFVHADAMRPALERESPLDDWADFTASWAHLAVDEYMADHGRYRRRRHAVYSLAADGRLQRLPHQPHFQSREYNSLNGGLERWFDPLDPVLGEGASMRAVLGVCASVFGALAPEVRAWQVEVHQFRIEARTGKAGLPTPEGVHRDGVDYVMVLLIDRHNIASGTTTVHAPDRQELGSFTLTRPCDATLLNDHRVFHGVTPIEPLNADLPAWRDVLVVTFRNRSEQ